jgi:hypothetical protein
LIQIPLWKSRGPLVQGMTLVPSQWSCSSLV